MEFPLLHRKQVERVPLACVQCRSRHVKCDSTQPTCNRCARDEKECTYLKSRRGGLDKAALARRRHALEQAAQQSASSNQSSTIVSSSSAENQHQHQNQTVTALTPYTQPTLTIPIPSPSAALSLPPSTSHLLDLYYTNFHPGQPFLLPHRFLTSRLSRPNHGLDALLPVLHWLGSLYSPSIPSLPYLLLAQQTLLSPTLPRSPFVVQAHLLLAIGELYQDLRAEARQSLDTGIALALELGMNEGGFVERWGEGDRVLEESWRRTWYWLVLADSHFAVSVCRVGFGLRDVEGDVGLVCEDGEYEVGTIPPPSTFQQYQNRKLSDQTIFSSFTYLYDVVRIVWHLMRSVEASGGIFSETLAAAVDTKLALWRAGLPACKSTPLREDGSVDECLWYAWMMWGSLILNTHRPFATLPYSATELSTTSFLSPIPLHQSPQTLSPHAHTARCRAAMSLHTHLLSLPTALDTHPLFTMHIIASGTAAQCSFLSVSPTTSENQSRISDGVHLGIATLARMGGVWELGRRMAEEVECIAAAAVAGREREIEGCGSGDGEEDGMMEMGDWSGAEGRGGKGRLSD